MNHEPSFTSEKPSLKYLIDSEGPQPAKVPQSSSKDLQRNARLHSTESRSQKPFFAKSEYEDFASRDTVLFSRQKTQIEKLQLKLDSISKQSRDLTLLSKQLTEEISNLPKSQNEKELAALQNELFELEKIWSEREVHREKVETYRSLTAENSELKQQVSRLIDKETANFGELTLSTVTDWVGLQRAQDNELIELSRNLILQKKEQEVLESKLKFLQIENENLRRGNSRNRNWLGNNENVNPNVYRFGHSEY